MAKTGNQKVTALKREDLEEIEKQRRTASAESNMFLFVSVLFTNVKFYSSVSHKMDFLVTIGW